MSFEYCPAINVEDLNIAIERGLANLPSILMEKSANLIGILCLTGYLQWVGRFQ
jgi:hypothetical protein